LTTLVSVRAVKVTAVEKVVSRYGITVVLAAGLGLRQGEVFGLSPNDVDWFGNEVTVQRQAGEATRHDPRLRATEGRKTRTVPLPEVVKTELSAYLSAFPAKMVTLLWREVDGGPTSVPLIVTTAFGNAVTRRHFDPLVWTTARERAEVPHARRTGCTPAGITTPACSWTPASRSRRSRST
jgi:integrase